MREGLVRPALGDRPRRIEIDGDARAGCRPCGWHDQRIRKSDIRAGRAGGDERQGDAPPNTIRAGTWCW